MANLKSCTKCEKPQPLSAFNKDRTRPDGHFPWCRECKKTYDRSAAPEYKIWKSIQSRCKVDPAYSHLEVHPSWVGRGNYAQFIKDMGERPSDQHQIDRIDNTKGYSPDNCRWSTKQQNIQNRRVHRHKTSCEYKGVFYKADGQRQRRWAAIIKANKKTYHLGNFHTKEEAALEYNKAALRLHSEFASLNEVK